MMPEKEFEFSQKRDNICAIMEDEFIFADAFAGCAVAPEYTQIDKKLSWGGMRTSSHLRPAVLIGEAHQFE